MEGPGTRHEINGRPGSGFGKTKYPQMSAATTGFAMHLARLHGASKIGRLSAREMEMGLFCGE